MGDDITLTLIITITKNNDGTDLLKSLLEIVNQLNCMQTDNFQFTPDHHSLNAYKIATRALFRSRLLPVGQVSIYLYRLCNDLVTGELYDRFQAALDTHFLS